MSRACEACQHVNDDATQFCGRCGQKLSGLILAIGATLDRGRYRLEKLLGEGGMGSVWQAHDTKLSRAVALKCLAAELTAHPTARRRMEQEAKILARVEHPNIVQVRNVFDESGILVMELEFVSGGDLESMVRPGGASEPAVLGRMVKVLSGLEALHSAGLVHRDIKPANVLLTDGGEPKITDLGVAHDPTAREKTRLGASLGTPDYMSPEQIQGMKVDARSDLYSMGVMAFQLLAGELPFVGNSEFDIHAAHVREPPDLARLRAVASPAAVDWIARALEKDPAARWQSAADMRKAAERVLAGKASGATAASPARTPAPLAAPARQAPASATQRAAERKDAAPVVVSSPATVAGGSSGGGMGIVVVGAVVAALAGFGWMVARSGASDAPTTVESAKADAPEEPPEEPAKAAPTKIQPQPPEAAPDDDAPTSAVYGYYDALGRGDLRAAFAHWGKSDFASWKKAFGDNATCARVHAAKELERTQESARVDVDLCLGDRNEGRVARWVGTMQVQRDNSNWKITRWKVRRQGICNDDCTR
jgi:serine/threonine-protein kinase